MVSPNLKPETSIDGENVTPAYGRQVRKSMSYETLKQVQGDKKRTFCKTI
jgi:hypothetical protein